MASESGRVESFGAETGKAAHDLKLFGQSVVITEFVKQLPGDLVHCRLEQDVADLRLVTEVANLPDECDGGFAYAVFQTKWLAWVLSPPHPHALLMAPLYLSDSGTPLLIEVNCGSSRWKARIRRNVPAAPQGARAAARPVPAQSLRKPGSAGNATGAPRIARTDTQLPG